MTALACVRSTAPIIYVTATPLELAPSAEATLPNPFLPTPTPSGPTATALQPTPNPPNQIALNAAPIRYTIQQGDTLSGLAALFGTTVAEILRLNPSLNENAVLTVGQVIAMPSRPLQTTPNFKIIPDSELVYSPGLRGFDVAAYIRFQPGFIRVYSENVGGGRFMSGAEIVQFVAQSASVNPRLLLALLEYRSGWITNPVPSGDALTYPMGYRSERARSLLSQLDWAAAQLNGGYYGWRTRGLSTLEFPDRSRLAFAPELNGGTVAVQNYLAKSALSREQWLHDVSPSGFFTTYMALFGDPFRYAIEPLLPPDLKQPELALPFPRGETWYLTAGPHGGWDARQSGWAAVDFAPPRPPDAILAAQGNCYVSPYFTTSMATGLVVRSGDGAVVVDLDMDGDERTGWTLVYLHIADADRVPAGTVVQVGSPIGRPSCEGLYLNSSGTHVHVARRYNGEWIVADCPACLPDVPNVPFVMSGWEVKGYVGQVYQGYLQKDGLVRRAEQGRDDPINQVQW
jgi:murein DD-endopeptidase MepM/ murein hydrolase activator NlpD